MSSVSAICEKYVFVFETYYCTRGDIFAGSNSGISFKPSITTPKV